MSSSPATAARISPRSRSGPGTGPDSTTALPPGPEAWDRSGLALRLGRIEGLDRAVEPAVRLVKRVLGPGPVKDVLSGTWLGHPLHPLLTDVPIGCFTSATVLDLVGGTEGERAADRLVGLGVLCALPTAAAGLSDWSDAQGADRRVGIVHAAANLTGVGLYAASRLARRRGRRVMGCSLGLLGMGVMTAGGYLGGHLTFARGLGVNNAFWQHPIEDWTPVCDEADPPEDEAVHTDVDGTGVLLYRRGDRVLAVGDRCTHAGGPLHEGEIDRQQLCVTCPWHQSVFRLEDGAVVHGPASVPAVAYEARTEGGKVHIRTRDRHTE
ncbi:MAG: Rieske 2Fe-2S domain-containing protein [Acidimicrobiales bacterium]